MSELTDEERRKAAQKLLAEETERRKQILREILEERNWAVEYEDLDDWLEIVDEFNKRVES